MRNRKEFKKLNLLMKLLLKRMYKTFGYEETKEKINNMNEPTSSEKEIMIQYIEQHHMKLNKTSI